MVKEDVVFGKMVFDTTWYKKDRIIFGGKEADIVILVAGEEDCEFEEGQYEAYKMLKKKWCDMQDMLQERILDYYKKRREELGYDIDQNEQYPEIVTTEQLLEHITLVGIKIPYAEIYGGRSIGLSFDCTWDNENGLGLRLCDEIVSKVGFQDIAL